MTAPRLITDNLDLWTAAVTPKAHNGRGNNGQPELTGIKKLRELILELAVRGKLVPQNPADEPASALLEKIAAEKVRLVKEGKIKKPKPLPAVGEGEQPFVLPEGWEWVRLGEVTNYGITEKVEPGEVAPDTWVLELEDIEKGSSRLLQKVFQRDRQFKSAKNKFYQGDVLYGKLRPYLDKVLVADASGVCTTEIMPIRAFMGLQPEYLRLSLKTPNFKNYATNSTHGMNLPRLGTEKARHAALSLPPVQEQHRIVEKVDELMALCDRLEQQTNDQLAAHETLVETLLDTLIRSPDATELAANWTRLQTHFDTLFTTESSIDRLKQTILQLAVMGRLVPQDPNDEPASALLEKIAAEKARLTKEGKIKKTKPLPEILGSEKPFKIPKDWLWVRFGTIVFNRDAERIPLSADERRNRPGRYDYYGASGVIDKMDAYLFDKPLLLIGEDGANLINRATPIAFIARGKYWVNNHAHVIDGISEDFLLYLCLHINAISLESYVTGTAQPKMNQAKMNTIIIGLPPAPEQKRIVQKVDELMALCDQFKTSLSHAKQIRQNLAEAVVTKTLAMCFD